MKLWVISDLHFWHENIIKYSNRPFANVDEMNRKLIENWNSVVGVEDKVIFLGDFAFGRHSIERDRNILNRLNGHKEILLGNHDKKFNSRKAQTNGTEEMFKVTIDNAEKYWLDVGFEKVYDKPFILESFYIFSHEPIEGINESQIFANIHGHIHDVELSVKNYVNVSVECIKYTPIDFEKIKEKFANEN